MMLLAWLAGAPPAVQGSGPTGQSVTLTLSLSFKPPSAGPTYAVEVAASNDRGDSQTFVPAGSVIIRR